MCSVSPACAREEAGPLYSLVRFLIKLGLIERVENNNTNVGSRGLS